MISILTHTGICLIESSAEGFVAELHSAPNFYILIRMYEYQINSHKLTLKIMGPVVYTTELHSHKHN